MHDGVKSRGFAWTGLFLSTLHWGSSAYLASRKLLRRTLLPLAKRAQAKVRVTELTPISHYQYL